MMRREAPEAAADVEARETWRRRVPPGAGEGEEGHVGPLARWMAGMLAVTAIWSWVSLLRGLALAPDAAPGAGLAQARCLASAYQGDVLAGGAAPMVAPPPAEASDATPRCSLPPIFVVGAARGGARLVFDALSATDAGVPVLGESNLFAAPTPATVAAPGGPSRGCPCRMDSRIRGIPLEGTARCGDGQGASPAVRDVVDCWARQCAAAGGRRWVEFSQKHIGAVARILRGIPGGAAVVVVVRDGRDVSTDLAARAIRGLEERGGSGPGGEVVAKDLSAVRKGACARWVSETRSALRAASRAEPPNEGLSVRYEDAVRFPEQTARTLAPLLAGDGSGRAAARAVADVLAAHARDGAQDDDGVRVGLWEGEMDAELADACRGTEDFVWLLHLLGYDEQGAWGRTPPPTYEGREGDGPDGSDGEWDDEMEEEIGDVEDGDDDFDDDDDKGWAGADAFFR